MHSQPHMTLEKNEQEDIDSLSLPACIVINSPSFYLIKHANFLFINLLKKDRDLVIGMAIEDVFPKSLEFKYYPYQNSLIEGLQEASSTKSKIKITPEHFVISINNDEAFEINKWALSITPVLNHENELKHLVVTVLD
jgi:hypothetical protein